jgi:hypothetical protein
MYWWPLGAVALHIIEEFVFPGGFADWDRRYRPAVRSSITPGFHLVVNAVLVLVCLVLGFVGPSPRGVAAWLTIAALLLTNAIFHVLGTYQTRTYSPGLVTGVILYVPLAVYGFTYFLRTGQASTGTALVALAIGGSYHLWSSLAHTARAQGREDDSSH